MVNNGNLNCILYYKSHLIQTMVIIYMKILNFILYKIGCSNEMSCVFNLKPGIRRSVLLKNWRKISHYFSDRAVQVRITRRTYKSMYCKPLLKALQKDQAHEYRFFVVEKMYTFYCTNRL